MKCVLDFEAEAANKIFRRTIDGLPLLVSPLEVRLRMYDLSPTAGINGEVE